MSRVDTEIVEANENNLGRRDFGVQGRKFAEAMADFSSARVYYNVGDDFEIISATFSPICSFLDCCMLYINYLYGAKNADGSKRFGVSAIRSAAAVLKKIGLFCQNVTSFKTALPQMDSLFKTWDKKASAPVKAAVFTDIECNLIMQLPITSESITLMVSFNHVLLTLHNICLKYLLLY